MFQYLPFAASAAGTAFSFFGASKSAEAQKRVAQLEMQIEAQRKLAMERDSQRRILEQYRQGQRARALSLTIATSQGAGTQSSALGGAYGQISGQMGTNVQGISQNLEIGRNIFDLNAQISREKMNIADAQVLSNVGSGLQSMGGSMMNVLPAFGRVTGGFGGGGPPYGGYMQGNYSRGY